MSFRNNISHLETSQEREVKDIVCNMFKVSLHYQLATRYLRQTDPY